MPWLCTCLLNNLYCLHWFICRFMLIRYVCYRFVHRIAKQLIPFVIVYVHVLIYSLLLLWSCTNLLKQQHFSIDLYTLPYLINTVPTCLDISIQYSALVASICTHFRIYPLLIYPFSHLSAFRYSVRCSEYLKFSFLQWQAVETSVCRRL